MYFSRIRLRPEKISNVAERLSKGSYGLHQLLWELFTEDGKRNFLFREEIAQEQLNVHSGARGEPVYYVVSASRPHIDHALFHVSIKKYQPQLQAGDRLLFELRANPVICRNGKKHDVPMDAQRLLLDSLCTELGLQPQLPEYSKKQEFKKLLLAYGGRRLDHKLTALLESNAHYAGQLERPLTLDHKLEYAVKSAVDYALEEWIISQGERRGFVICRDKYNQLKLQSSRYLWHPLIGKSTHGVKAGFNSVDFTGELEVNDVENFKHTLFHGIGRSKAFGCGLLIVRRA